MRITGTVLFICCTLTVCLFTSSIEKQNVLLVNLKLQEDTIIKWSPDYRLQFSDFQGTPRARNGDSDTLAICSYDLKYQIKLENQKFKMDIYAIFFKRSSWMRVKTPHVLAHEQGHFDIAEIYALRLKQNINASGLSNPHDFFTYFDSSSHNSAQECNAEQKKYDIWTLNTFGRDYYFNWIKQQLDSLRKLQ